MNSWPFSPVTFLYGSDPGLIMAQPGIQVISVPLPSRCGALVSFGLTDAALHQIDLVGR